MLLKIGLRIVFKMFLLLSFVSTYIFIKDRSAVVTPEQLMIETVTNERNPNAYSKGENVSKGKEPTEEKPPSLLKDNIKLTKEQQKLLSQWKVEERENKKAVGWISIAGMKINYPIMYAEDNEFFLKHDKDGKNATTGAIFLDAFSKGDFGRINLIHGHNLRSGKMFGDLDRYKEKDFLNNHRIIDLVQNGEVKQYKIFSVLTFDAGKEKIETGFSTELAYQDYFTALKKRSKFDLTSPKTIKNILILNTCSYEFTNAHLLVCAYEI